VLPPFSVNTAAAYGWLAAARETEGHAEGVEVAGPALDAAVLSPEALSDWSVIEGLATNDFEAVVAARHPSIGAIVERLRGFGCAPALMSGSGSSVFGVLPGTRGVELPRFAQTANEPAPRVLLTRSAVGVAEVVVSVE
jgi:4-diphosphocytidyl-2C-methyl-D-erythritol kinase